MAPIPIFSNSPIVASKADGISPKTTPPGPAATTTAPSTTTTAPTPTTTAAAPQPGAVPFPAPTGIAIPTQPSAPPAPTPVAAPATTTPAAYAPPAPTAAPAPNSTKIPYQTALPPLNYLPPAISSMPSTTPSYQQQTPLPALSHPPGYQQNSHATADTQMGYESRNAGLPGGAGPAEEDAGLWDTAKRWVQGAGESLSAVESEVWKKITPKD